MAHTLVCISTPGQTTPVVLRRVVEGGAVVPGVLTQTVRVQGLVIEPQGPAHPDPSRIPPSVFLDMIEPFLADHPAGKETTGAERQRAMQHVKDRLFKIPLSANPALHSYDVRAVVAEVRARHGLSLEDAIECVHPRSPYDAETVLRMCTDKPLRLPFEWQSGNAEIEARYALGVEQGKAKAAEEAAAKVALARRNDKTLADYRRHGIKVSDPAVAKILARAPEIMMTSLFDQLPSIREGTDPIYLIPCGAYPFMPKPGKYGPIELLPPSTRLDVNGHAMQVAKLYSGPWAVEALKLFRRWDAGPCTASRFDFDLEGKKAVALATKHARPFVTGLEKAKQGFTHARSGVANQPQNAEACWGRQMHGFLKSNALAAEIMIRGYGVAKEIVPHLLINIGKELAAEQGIDFPVYGFNEEEINPWLQRFVDGGPHVSCSPDELYREMTDAEFSDLLIDNPAYDPFAAGLDELIEKGEPATQANIIKSIEATGQKISTNQTSHWVRVKNWFESRGFRKDDHAIVRGKRTTAWVPAKQETSVMPAVADATPVVAVDVAKASADSVGFIDDDKDPAALSAWLAK